MVVGGTLCKLILGENWAFSPPRRTQCRRKAELFGGTGCAPVGDLLPFLRGRLPPPASDAGSGPLVCRGDNSGAQKGRLHHCAFAKKVPQISTLAASKVVAPDDRQGRQHTNDRRAKGESRKRSNVPALSRAPIRLFQAAGTEALSGMGIGTGEGKVIRASSRQTPEGIVTVQLESSRTRRTLNYCCARGQVGWVNGIAQRARGGNVQTATLCLFCTLD